MAESESRKGWNGVQRSDGAWVGQAPGGNWIFMPADNQLPIFSCPCCKKLFAKAYAAMAAGDGIYPPSSSGSSGNGPASHRN